MEDLKLVGVSDDGSRLVIESGGGERYTLVLDERLHAALRGDRSRLGQLQIALGNELRPREIQTRIRAGETAEAIATEAGVPVERVRRYEGPVLLERTVVAQDAQTVGVRRVTDSTTTPLGVLVRARLADHAVGEEDLDWDSWLQGEGRWLVRLTYSVDGRDRVASWLYDPARRTVEPADDDARWLTDEERAGKQPPRSRPARLAAVPAHEPDAEAGHHDTVPLAPRRRPQAVPDPEPELEAGAGTDVEEVVELDLADDVVDETVDETLDDALDVDAPDEDAQTEPAPAPARGTRTTTPRGRTGKRATVPSWDEILFGGPKRED